MALPATVQREVGTPSWKGGRRNPHRKGKAGILGDVPVPGEDGGPASPPAQRHAWPPEVPIFLGGPKDIGHIVIRQFLEDLREKMEHAI